MSFSYSCGQNSCGELATKRKGDRVILTPLKDYVFKQIRSIGSGYEFSVVVDKNGKIKGYGKASGLKFNKTVKKVVSGFTGIALVTVEDEVYYKNKLEDEFMLLPKPNETSVVSIVHGLKTFFILYSNGDLYENSDKIHSNVSVVFSGNYASNYFFINNQGKLYASGKNTNGQLGIGKISQNSNTIELKQFKNQQIIHIACGYEHSCMILQENGIGQVYGVGKNEYNGIGGTGNSTKFQKIVALKDYDAIFVDIGCFHTVVQMKDYSTWGWGNNIYGQLGIGAKNEHKKPIPIHTRRFPGNDPRFIHCGPFNTFVYSISSMLQKKPKKKSKQSKTELLDNNQTDNIITKDKIFCYCCGQNEKGELGSIEKKKQTSLIQVMDFEGVMIQSIASGYQRTLIVDTKGKVTGYGDFSELKFTKKVKKVVIGFQPCALLTYDNEIYISEKGENPILLSKPSGKSVISMVPGILSIYILYSNGDLYENSSKIHSNVTKVFSGNYASNYFFINNEGSLYACGKNANGQLGIGKISQNSNTIELKQFKNQQIIHIACGYEHSCMILQENGIGQVYGVGKNEYNGIGGTGNSTKFQKIEELKDYDAIFVGIGCFHTIVQMKDNSVWGWGNNAYGQLGKLKISGIEHPRLLNLSPLSQNESKTIHCGCFNTFVASVKPFFNDDSITEEYELEIQTKKKEIKKKNQGLIQNKKKKKKKKETQKEKKKKKKIVFSYSCGQNSCGELATNKKGDQFNFTPLNDYASKQIRSIASGFERTLIVDKKGKVTGYGEFSNLTLNKKVKKVVSGFHPCAFLTFDDEVYLSKKGDNTILLPKPSGTSVVSMAPGIFTIYILYSNGDLYEKSNKIHSNVTKVFSGNYASNYFFINNEGCLYASGKNKYGQLGIGTISSSSPKSQVLDINGRDVIQISCGFKHTTIIVKDKYGIGQVYGVGNNEYNGIGGTKNSTRFQIIKELIGKDAIFVDNGCFHTIVQMKDNSIWGWGNNAYGQLKTKSRKSFLQPTELILSQIPTHNGLIIECGCFNTFIYSPLDKDEYNKTVENKPIQEDHENNSSVEFFIYSCGQNNKSELGLKEKKEIHNLTQLPDFENQNIQSIASGYERTLIVDTKGKVTGYGDFSELKLNKKVKKVVSGFYPCALLTYDNEIYISEKGENPILLSKPSGTSVISMVPGILSIYILYSNGDLYENSNKIHSNVTKVFSGNYASHYFFINNEGSLYACGKNANGQLGIGKISQNSNTIELKQFKNQQIIHIACGYEHSCMILQENGIGQVYGVGKNEYNGIGGNGNSTKFQKIVALKDYDAIFVGVGCFHTIVQMKDNSVWGWGNNSFGQLGVGSTNSYVQPIQLFQTPLEPNQPRKIHCGCFNTFVYSSIDQIIQISPLQEDLLSLFERQENCDHNVTLIDSKTIQFHSILTEIRTGKDGETLAKILSKYNIIQAQIILKWIYTGFSQEKDQKQIRLMKQFCKKLKLNFLLKTGLNGLLSDLKRLYDNELSKDFILCVDQKEIVVHKIILQARSQFFRGMFLKNPKESYVTDYSKKSYKALETLIKYFYSDIVDNSAPQNVLSELKQVNYFLLNPRNTLKKQVSVLINNFNKKFQQKKKEDCLLM
ncbi:hypothetical protein M0813_23170 [Anaeramoeba flamelloides]|uniref:BTB domain-containing protein n=1 Tax=Anaeramoeba flamelloides TaxID=1746091 RepID=A0ABQ8YAL1_9EUKA|nr:hypothetical protein M0813_23170 [Anaeramoeba flamelloides]